MYYSPIFSKLVRATEQIPLAVSTVLGSRSTPDAHTQNSYNESMQTSSSTSVVLLSAGLDSTVSLALALEQGESVALALTLDYGQRAQKAEHKHAGLIAQHYGIPWQSLNLEWLGQITQTALSQSSHHAIPDIPIQALDHVATVTLASANQVWVPNRNGLFINVAGCFADSYGYTQILAGFNAEEAATFSDNTPQFTQAISNSLAFSTQVQPVVLSHVQHLNKMEIFLEALRLEVPLKWLWSCYQEGKHHCGQCESCNRLKRAAIACGRRDLLPLWFESSDV